MDVNYNENFKNSVEIIKYIENLKIKEYGLYFYERMQVYFEKGSLLARAVVLNMKIDEIFEALKKDLVLKEYLEKEFVDGTCGEKYSREDRVKDHINCFIFSGKKEEICFDSVANSVGIPLEISKRIEEVFNSSEDIKKIINEKTFNDEKYLEIKKRALEYVNRKRESYKRGFEYHCKVPEDEQWGVYKKHWATLVQEHEKEFWFKDVSIYIWILQKEKELIELFLGEIINDNVKRQFEKRFEKLTHILKEENFSDLYAEFREKQKKHIEMIEDLKNTPRERFSFLEMAGCVEQNMLFVEERIKEIEDLTQKDVEDAYLSFRIGVKKGDQFIEKLFEKTEEGFFVGMYDACISNY